MISDSSLFSSLRHPAFRLLWIAGFLMFLSWNVQNVLVSWLVLDVTDSSMLLGVIMALSFAPQAFGVIAGSVADRMRKDILIILVNAIQIIFAMIMGLLIMGGEIEIWHIALIVFTGNSLSAFSMPAQSAYIVDIVGENNITNATSLNMIGTFVAGVVGPSLVGFLVNLIGIASFFYLNAIFYMLTIGFVLMISRKVEVDAPKVQRRFSVFKDIKDGFKFSWNTKAVLGGQLIYLITNLFMWPCIWTLIPIFSRTVLRIDASGLGWLTAASQLGGFVANLILAAKDPEFKGRLLLVTSIAWGATWFIFSNLVWLPISIFSLLVMGMMSSFTMTLASIIQLIYAGPEIRGRVMGIQTLAISSQSPGSLIAGILAQIQGPAKAINIEAIMFIFTILILAKTVPDLIKAK